MLWCYIDYVVFSDYFMGNVLSLVCPCKQQYVWSSTSSSKDYLYNFYLLSLTVGRWHKSDSAQWSKQNTVRPPATDKWQSEIQWKSYTFIQQ